MVEKLRSTIAKKDKLEDAAPFVGVSLPFLVEKPMKRPLLAHDH